MNTGTTQKTTGGKSTTPLDWKIIVRFVLVTGLTPLLLFVAAGSIDWWQGWVYVFVSIVLSLVSRYIMFLKNPDLIAERARFTEAEGIKDWDKWIAIIIALVAPIIFIITAGLDRRFGWSSEVALSLQIAALVIFLLGFTLATWATTVNTFFSSVVRIQTDRGQTVVTSGPYQFVRHPGYSGGIVSWLVSPILLGSLWSFIPAGVVVVLTIVRTVLEDRTLQAELPGYKEYTQRTRFRLFPFIW